MAKIDKKDKKNIKKVLPPPPSSVGISRRGKITIAAGMGVLILGFLTLKLTDPAGQNWASTLSPFLILGGYAIIGVGIVLPDPPAASKSQSPTTG